MEKLIKLVETMKPFFEKVSNNPYLRAIRDGFVSCIPVILFCEKPHRQYQSQTAKAAPDQ